MACLNLLSQRPEQNSAKKKPDRSCSAQTQQGLGGQTGFNENRRIEDGGFGRGPSLLAAGCASSCAQPQARLFGMVADEVTRPDPPGTVTAPASSRRPLPVSENAWVHVLGHRWQKVFLFFMSLPAFLWPTSSPMFAVTDLTKSFVSPEGTRLEIVSVKAFALDGGAF